MPFEAILCSIFSYQGFAQIISGVVIAVRAAVGDAIPFKWSLKFGTTAAWIYVILCSVYT